MPLIAVSTPAMTAPARRMQLLGLVWTLVRTDFKTRYHGTFGGFAWALLKPFSMFLVLLGVFSFIFASDPTYKVNLIVGLFLWDFFAESTKTGLVALHGKGYLLTKARFPSWIVVVTACANPLLTLAVATTVILGFLSVTGRAPSALELLLFLSYVCALVLIVIGISLTGSVLLLRYRDLNQVWEVLIQAGFFIAPIVYPLRIMPERYHFYLYLWPPTPIIQFSRAVLVEHAVPSLKAHALLAGLTCAIVAVGTVIYRRHSPRAAEDL
jgi:lipopolysaccharide transport system permease protein